jgi:hypothetical protein
MCQSQESSQVHVSLFYPRGGRPFVYDIFPALLCWAGHQRTSRGKDTLQVCLSVIDQTGRVSVKATTKVVNKPIGFASLLTWVSRHRKVDLPLIYLMESTGVYHEAVAWYLHQQDQSVSILLPNKAKYYLKSLGYNRAAGAVQKRQD